MDQQALMHLLRALHDRTLGVDEAARKLKDISFGDMGFAKIDHHRALRVGLPEVIYCQGKSDRQIVEIARHMIEHDETVFGTRACNRMMDKIGAEFKDVEVSRTGRCFWRKSSTWKKQVHVKGTIVIASAGTSDAPVVEEARCTVEILGHPCAAIQDVGVAGIHRLFAHGDDLRKASVIIAVAGMEGALPSVVAGLVSCPVIGVPTSVGYGAHLGGMVPLFAMLN